MRRQEQKTKKIIKAIILQYLLHIFHVER
uniref:Photosystem I subunit VIII n=2 Tax=Hansenia oviformis TaxID=1978917 RepID=A0A1Y0B5M2_9APIA|nr:photosystem I subunit VIII [Hansenia oviformis]ART32711.1 photosystem I subunit VIII [Hansenia oviformis]QHV37360.1 photosystem I subunit VIII [Hansenia oviformis]